MSAELTAVARQALIDAGWLPPEDHADLRTCAQAANNNGEPIDPGRVLDIIGWDAQDEEIP